VKVLIISCLVLIVDQTSKLLIKGLEIHSIGLNFRGLFPGQRIPVIGNFFNITFVENPGIAFGLDFGDTFKLLVSIFTLVACVLLVYFLFKNRKKGLNLRISLALILGGALGNLFDRLFYGLIYGYAPMFYGKVVDFFDIRMFNIYLFHHMVGNYVFNFADFSVTVGVILLFYAYNKERSQDKDLDVSLEKYLAENKE
jgi:signal peptidase II